MIVSAGDRFLVNYIAGPFDGDSCESLYMKNTVINVGDILRFCIKHTGRYVLYEISKLEGFCEERTFLRYEEVQ